MVSVDGSSPRVGREAAILRSVMGLGKERVRERWKEMVLDQ